MSATTEQMTPQQKAAYYDAIEGCLMQFVATYANPQQHDRDEVEIDLFRCWLRSLNALGFENHLMKGSGAFLIRDKLRALARTAFIGEPRERYEQAEG